LDMRMWNVSPRLMCDKHLLGEHLEMHMFVGCLRQGKSLDGFIKNGLVEVHNISFRHMELVSEMHKRGMKHDSKISEVVEPPQGNVDVVESLALLAERCPECRKRMVEAGNEDWY